MILTQALDISCNDTNDKKHYIYRYQHIYMVHFEMEDLYHYILPGVLMTHRTILSVVTI